MKNTSLSALNKVNNIDAEAIKKLESALRGKNSKEKISIIYQILSKYRSSARIPGSLKNGIHDIIVIEPNPGLNENIKVLYCRDSKADVDQDYNYIYYNLPYDGQLDIKLPFSGAIYFDANYEILNVDLLNLHMALNKKTEGMVRFEKEDYSENRFVWEIYNSRLFNPDSAEDETILIWSFNENWNNVLNINTGDVCNIAVKIPLVVRKINDDGTKTHPFSLNIFLTSDYTGTPAIDCIKVSSNIEITVRPFPIQVPYLQSIFTGALSQSRAYSCSGIANLSNGTSFFIVAGGTCTKGLTSGTNKPKDRCAS